MPKGRPVKSQIRQNIVDVLFFLKKGYGYNIHKIYKKIFPACTMKSIYYHLKKGVELKEFKVQKITSEKGNYSWGDKAEKIYYTIGPMAKPTGNEQVRKFLEKDEN